MKDEKGKTPIIILHGWGLRGDTYREVTKLLKEKELTVYPLDLPGFGSEPLGKKKLNLNDYVLFVHDFITKKKLKNIILFGHSFGGRVSIKFATVYPKIVYALILTGVPGIKQKLSLPRRIVQYAVVSVGDLFRIPALFRIKQVLRRGLYFMIGEWDYYNAGDLRETFKNVIGEDLKSLLSSISIPTLLVWGENDTVILLSVGKEMKDIIPHSKLIVIKERGHKLPYESPKEFFEAIYPFLKSL